MGGKREDGQGSNGGDFGEAAGVGDFGGFDGESYCGERSVREKKGRGERSEDGLVVAR